MAIAEDNGCKNSKLFKEQKLKSIERVETQQNYKKHPTHLWDAKISVIFMLPIRFHKTFTKNVFKIIKDILLKQFRLLYKT